MNAISSSAAFAMARLHIARAHGQTFQRISASHTYTHIVIGRPSLDHALAQGMGAGADRTPPDGYYDRWQALGWYASEDIATRSAAILRQQDFWAEIHSIPVLITRAI